METILEKAAVTVANDKPTRSATFVERVGNLLPKAYWPWLFLAVSVGLITLTPLLDETISFVHGFVDGLFQEAATGYNKGYKRSGDASGAVLTARSFGGVLLGLFALAFVGVLLLAVSWFHYRFLYKKILLNPGTGYTALYIFWLVVFWRSLIYLENGLKAGFSAGSVEFATFVTGVCIVYAFFRNSQESRRRQLLLVQQRTQAELDALKAQVNPHFLFNSLNNIYGTAIVEDSPRTAESIQQLSGIVRYVMEESRLQTTDVRRELRFIDDYVELQRVRIPDQENIEITTDIEWDEKPAQIVPLLLNPLIENAFKYGISIQYPCFVRIRLRVQDGTLRLTTENSILPRTDLEKGTGIGLANVRKRLSLAYPDRHSLTVSETDDVFLVDLRINLADK